jgi:diketogulonate reductase-like aldo/keto reductase
MRPEQVRANAEGAKWELATEDLEEIDRITHALSAF